jgi:hypothetical protein
MRAFGDDCRRVRLSNSFVGSDCVLHKRVIIDDSSNSSWVGRGQGRACCGFGDVVRHGCPTEAQLGASQLHHAADALAWGAIERDSTVQPAETPQSRNTGPGIIIHCNHSQSVDGLCRDSKLLLNTAQSPPKSPLRHVQRCLITAARVCSTLATPIAAVCRRGWPR